MFFPPISTEPGIWPSWARAALESAKPEERCLFCLDPSISAAVHSFPVLVLTGSKVRQKVLGIKRLMIQAVEWNSKKKTMDRGTDIPAHIPDVPLSGWVMLDKSCD